MSKARRKKRSALPLPSRATPSAPPPAPDPATTIVVGGTTRRAERKRAKQIKRRNRGIAVAAVVALAAVVVATGAIVFARHHKKADATGGVRTQRTLLLQVTGSNGEAIESALLATDPKKKTAAVVLVPSRVIAEIPGRGASSFGRAVALAGPKGSRDALADLMGVTVDGAWVLTQEALAGLIDRLGGIDADVDTDVLGPGSGGTRVVLVRAGQQHLNGASAVAFAGYLASGESELSRLPRLQGLIDGLAAAAKAKGQSAVATAISVGRIGQRLDRPPAEVAQMLIGVSGPETTEASLPVHDIDTGGPTAYGIDPTGLQSLISSALADSVPESVKATSNRVLVQNGVGTPGVGESVRTKLVNAGFVYRAGGNVPGFTFQHKPSVVLIADGTQPSVEAGQRVARALGLPASDIKISTEGQSVADIIVIVGSDYRP